SKGNVHRNAIVQRPRRSVFRGRFVETIDDDDLYRRLPIFQPQAERLHRGVDGRCTGVTVVEGPPHVEVVLPRESSAIFDRTPQLALQDSREFADRLALNAIVET